MNIRELLEESFQKNPKKPFLFFKDEEISYEAFHENVYRTANWFKQLGIGKGDRVCVSLPNCPEFLYIWLGLSCMGGIIVPINIAYKENESDYVLKNSEPVALVGNRETLGVMKNIYSSLPGLKYVISVERDENDLGTLDFMSFKKENPQLEEISILSGDDISSIMYTSGTTGPPKGVMVTHRAYVCCGQGYTYWAGITEKDRLYTCLPLYHANAQYYSTMGSLAAGGSLVLINRFSASRFWDQIRHYEATIFNFIGAMLIILMKQSESPQDRQHRVRVAYGTPALDKELQDHFEERFGLTVLTGYALTECPFGTIQPLKGVRKPKSIGLPRYHPEFINRVLVVDEEGHELPPNQVGELIIKNPTVTPGYFRNPEETNKILRDGWLHTGDNGFRDEEGYYYFVDRKKDVIRRRGENFSSLEIEEVLNAHPKVLESAVIGIPSEFSDEEVKAYIIPKDGVVIRPAEIFDWCEKRLARFKVPRYLEFRESLPNTPTHRVEKYRLRQERRDLTEGCIDREKMLSDTSFFIN